MHGVGIKSSTVRSPRSSSSSLRPRFTAREDGLNLKISQGGRCKMQRRRLLLVLLVICLVLSPVMPAYTSSPPAPDNDMPLMIGDPYALWEDEFIDFAQPFPGEIILFQPDGACFAARLNPMEVGGQLETLDGYTILVNDDGWWTYADLIDGQLAPSSDIVTRDEPGSREKKLGYTKNIWADDEGNDIREPLFDAVRDVYSPNNSIFAAQSAETVVRNYVVLLVEFQDVKFQSHQTREWFQGRISGLGTSPTGTVSEFYYENSYGKFLPVLDVYGPFTSSYNLSRYDYQLSGQSSYTVAWMINNDIGPKVKDLIDWDKYDNTRTVTSGYRSVDMVVVIQAGPGKEATGQPGHIWSHATTANFRTGQYGDDGRELRIRAVNINPGFGFNIGVVCHEMGHSIGEPDYYNTSGTTSGSGEWEVMASGSWLGNDPAGSNPTHHNPFVKSDRQGWITPTVITGTTYGVQLRPRSAYPDLIMIPLGGSGTGSTGALERLYIEFISTREPGSIFDRAAPGSGLLIWHYDAGGSQTNNASPIARMRMRVEEYDYLDGTQELGTLFHNRGEPTDPWFETVIGMTPYTVPSTNRNTLLSGTRLSGWHITNISVMGDTMTFDLVKEADLGKVVSQQPRFTNEPVIQGRGPATLTTKVHNCTDSGLTAATVQFWVQAGTDATIVAETVANLPVGATDVTAVWNTPVSGKYRAWTTIAGVSSIYDEGTIRVFERQAPVLIVDDDDSYGAEEAYEGMLTALGVPYVMVTKTTTLDVLNQYELVIWHAGQAGRAEGQLSAHDRSILKAYLNAGGKLWINSPRLAAALNTVESTMLRDYFGASWPRANQDSGGAVVGLGQPIGGTGSFPLRAYPGRSIQDFLVPATSTRGTVTPLFTWSEGYHLGIEVRGNAAHNNFHVVYFGFCLSQLVHASDRLALAQQVLDHFGVTTTYTDKATYLVQSATAAQIFVRDPGATEPVGMLFSDAMLEGRQVRFQATDIPGTFVAAVNLQTKGSSGNVMKVNATDKLRVEYRDSAGVLRWGTADIKTKVDTDKPATIHHDRIFTTRDAEPLPVLAVVTDDISVKRVDVFYRVAGTQSYTRLKMEQMVPGAYTAVIPDGDVTPVGLEYFIVASDSKGNVTYHGTSDRLQFVAVQPRTLLQD